MPTEYTAATSLISTYIQIVKNLKMARNLLKSVN